MAKTNTQIQQAFYAAVDSAAFGYPIAWPGIDFSAPQDGYWLEVSFAPNEGMDEGLAYDSSVIPRGLFQIVVATRPDNGHIGLSGVADAVAAEFPKGTVVDDPVRIIRAPYQSDPITMDDRVMIPVTFEYSG